MTHSPAIDQTRDLRPPIHPSDAEFKAFMQRCIEARLDRLQMFTIIGQVWPETTPAEGQANG